VLIANSLSLSRFNKEKIEKIGFFVVKDEICSHDSLPRFAKICQKCFLFTFFSFFNQKMCLQHPLWQQMNHTPKLNSKRFFFFSDFLILIAKKLTFGYKRVYLNNFNRSHVTQTQKNFFIPKKRKWIFFHSKDKRAEFCAQLDIFSQIIAAWTLISEMFPSHSMFLCIF
jgi:hypothetical protein